MHGPFPPQLMHLLSQGQPMPRQEAGGTWGLVFQAVSSISLGLMTARMLYEMASDRHEKRSRRNREEAGEEIRPAVRREVERALSKHLARGEGRSGQGRPGFER